MTMLTWVVGVAHVIFLAQILLKAFTLTDAFEGFANLVDDFLAD